MATTHIDYRKIDYDQLLDKPIIRTDASVDTLTTAGVYDKGDGKRYIVSVNGQNITQVIEEKDGYQTRSSTDGGTTWGAWETVQFSKSGDIDAEDVNYDNTASELTATDVQAAIDEIDTSVDTINTTITNIQSDITDIQGDITDIKNIVEVETMPTPSEESEGTIIQYKGETTASFTHGYFYECVGDGQDPESFARVRIDVQPAGAGDEHEFITQAAYDLLTPAQKAAKVYMIKEEGVPGSGLTAGAGIDITNDVISADMGTAVYDNTTSGATATNVQDAIDEVFQSVSNGKELIADAITDKGVSTSATDSFQTMASNIESIGTTLGMIKSYGVYQDSDQSMSNNQGVAGTYSNDTYDIGFHYIKVTTNNGYPNRLLGNIIVRYGGKNYYGYIDLTGNNNPTTSGNERNGVYLDGEGNLYVLKCRSYYVDSMGGWYNIFCSDAITFNRTTLQFEHVSCPVPENMTDITGTNYWAVNKTFTIGGKNIESSVYYMDNVNYNTSTSNEDKIQSIIIER